MFRIAIVRKPCSRFPEGLTTVDLGKPDIKIALTQHEKYVDALRKCGLEVRVLDPDDNFPDSTFVEDTALCTPDFAIITNPGAKLRNGEKYFTKDILKEYFDNIEEIKYPGTLDGGDVLKIENHFYIGISRRTNIEGAEQAAKMLAKFGLCCSFIELKEFLHLKTGVSYLKNNNILLSGELIERKEFENYNRIKVSSEESYSANCLWINGKVLFPAGFPETKKKIENLGYDIIELDMSEFQKLDGGLSCLSLRF